MMYTTVFDIALEGYTAWWGPAVGLGFAAIGAVFVLKPELLGRLKPSYPTGPIRRVVSWIWFLFPLTWTIIVFSATFGDYERGLSALKNGKASVVEGPVTNFVPMPYAGHAQEHFTVSGQRFSYSDYSMASSFHNSASYGGPIHEGLQVRITYVGNSILRLEIAQ